ncbi:MAG: hypothetical protein ABIS39_08980 [Sphingomicrobium sp.]
MKRHLILIALGTVALAACNAESENIVAGGPPDPMAGDLAAAPPVELPPAIAASKTYRCKDNSLVSIDWLADNKSANLRVGNATTPVQLKAAVEGEALTAADGTSLTGNATAASVSLTLAGKGAQSCKA